MLVVQKNLEVGEVLTIDVSCIAALTPSIDVQIKYNAPLRRALFGVHLNSPSHTFYLNGKKKIQVFFGLVPNLLQCFNIKKGDNVVMATLKGPGIVFIQSLPFHRLSQRIAR